MRSFKLVLLVSTALSLTNCAGSPMGPTVRALPAQGKPFEQFQVDQNTCKQYASDQTRGQADSANTTALLEGIGGTALGAGLGAAIGGGHGAAVGAAGGAIAGTAVGASTSGHQQKTIQQQYDDAYAQCMVAKGNQIQQPAPRTTVIYTPPPPTVIYTQPPPTVVYTQPPPPTVVYTQPPVQQQPTVVFTNPPPPPSGYPPASPPPSPSSATPYPY